MPCLRRRVAAGRGLHRCGPHRAPARWGRLPGQPLVVVAGHSHMAAVEQRGDVLYLNPGSAGPRRFGRARTIARLEIWPAPAKETAGNTADEPPDAADAPRVTVQIITVEDD